MHALARCSPLWGLLLILLAPPGSAWSVSAVVGEPAPEFSLPSIHSNSESIQLSEFRGKVVYLDFWSAWCASCRRAMPELDALRRQLPRDQFEIISVNVDAVSADGRRFLEQFPVSHPVAVDAARYAAARYGVVTLPMAFLIDRDGVLQEVIQGVAVEDAGPLRARLLLLIGEDAIK